MPQIKSTLPRIVIDGELWFGRGAFSMTANFLHGYERMNWNLLRMIFFDSASMLLQNEPFETRYHHLINNVPHSHPFLLIALRFLCTSSTSLNVLMTFIVKDAGEGFVLRMVGSKYEHGRSTSLLKLKAEMRDAEGVVVRISNRTVTLKLPDGTQLEVPPSNVQVTKLSVGDVVTFSYENRTKTTFVNPKIFRLRRDLQWENVLHVFSKSDSNVTEFTNDKMTKTQMRAFLEQLAEKRNLDPLLHSSWQEIKEHEVRQSKIGQLIIRKCQGYASALQTLFPDVQFPKALLDESFSSVEKRRRFCEEFARTNGFDPLVAQNWYPRKSRLKHAQGFSLVSQYYRGSVGRTLIELFPEIVDKSILLPCWEDPARRRRFFMKYAREKGFDPFNAEAWYSHIRSGEMHANCGNAVRKMIIRYHRNLATALVDLFPDVRFEKSNLNPNPWHNIATRRKFFEEYAKKNHFDPLNPECWYNAKTKEIRTLPEFALVRNFYSSVPMALIHLFPDVKFDASKFKGIKSLRNPVMRRATLVEVARVNRFDPLVPKNWYDFRMKDLPKVKGARALLYHHGYNMKTAICDLFPEIGLQRDKLNNCVGTIRCSSIYVYDES